jgi:hypothetical protein
MPYTRRKTRSHQLVTPKLLLASQTTDGFTVEISRDASRYLDGWFH